MKDTTRVTFTVTNHHQTGLTLDGKILLRQTDDHPELEIAFADELLHLDFIETAVAALASRMQSDIAHLAALCDRARLEVSA